MSAAQASCADCLRSPLPLAAAWAAVDYAFPWRNLILRLKQEEPGLAAELAGLWPDDHPAAQWVRQGWMVLPIPSSAHRMQGRGYNHSRALAQAWCQRLGLEQALAPSGWLLRQADAPAQQGTARAKRLRQLRHAFIVPPEYRARLQGQSVLLIDDVMTTGATLSAAALALQQAGATRVSALVLARTASD